MQKSDKASSCQVRHLQYISEFVTKIKFISGERNVVVDILSGIEEISLINYNLIAKEWEQDVEF